MTIIFAPNEIALMISTICCCAMFSFPTIWDGSSLSSRALKNSAASAFIFAVSTVPNFVFGSWPRNMFSAIVIYGISINS